MSQNAMRDGVFVSSSQYEARRIVARFQIFKASRDLAAVQLQLLARELDRTDNYLKLQHDGASKPVFFKLFRSDMSAIRDIPGQSSAYECEVEFLAEPFALGLREDLGPFTVNNDPAHASNGLFFDVTGIIGDVSAPAVMLFDTALDRYGYLAVRQHGTPGDLTFWKQCESMTLGADTTDPGGGPDAAMSGAGTNNYARTSFATTTTMATRVSGEIEAQSNEAKGRYRILAAVRRSDNTSVMTARWRASGGNVIGETVTIPLTAERQLLDLGIYEILEGAPDLIGYGEATQVNINIALQAARSSGAGTLDWDFVAAIPADESMLVWDVGTNGAPIVLDGYSGGMYDTSETGADLTGLFDGTGIVVVSHPVSGGFPQLVPNQTNRIYVLTSNSTAHAKSANTDVSVAYWPRYLYIRPSAT